MAVTRQAHIGNNGTVPNGGQSSDEMDGGACDSLPSGGSGGWWAGERSRNVISDDHCPDSLSVGHRSDEPQDSWLAALGLELRCQETDSDADSLR